MHWGDLADPGSPGHVKQSSHTPGTLQLGAFPVPESMSPPGGPELAGRRACLAQHRV